MKKSVGLLWTEEPDNKVAVLSDVLRQMGSAVVAYSGGADSSLLVAVAHHTLGNRALAVTAVSPTFPRCDLREACRQARRYGWSHRLITTQELKNEKFACNPTDRCYYCKQELFHQLWKIARAEGFRWVVDGSNTDDLSDYRPGARAKTDLGVRSPLQEAGFNKADVRSMARLIGLMTADKPASACLASRFPYGTHITKASLKAIEKSENVLHKLGFKQVRVRMHGDIARIELDLAELDKSLIESRRCKIVAALKQCGFRYITLDLEGYRTGSMNTGIKTDTDKRSSKK